MEKNYDKISDEELEYTVDFLLCLSIKPEIGDFLEFPHLYKNLFKAYLKDKRKSKN